MDSHFCYERLHFRTAVTKENLPFQLPYHRLSVWFPYRRCLYPPGEKVLKYDYVFSLLHFETLARLTVAHVLLCLGIIALPVVAQRYSGERLFSAKMASGGVVVAFLQHLATMLFWYHQFPSVLIVAEGWFHLLIRYSDINCQLRVYMLGNR